MLKNGKRIFAAFIAVAMLASLTTAFAAEISWDASDYTVAAVIYQSDFEDGNNTIGGTNDSTTFASDASHSKVIYSTGGQVGERPGTLKDNILARKKINIKFDYYSEEGDTLRVEFRSMATNSSGGELYPNTADYWTGDATQKAITNGQWNTFNGTFDVDGYLKSIEGGTGVTIGTSPYLFIKPNNGKAFYIDNMEITLAPELLPFMEPSVTYDSGMTKVDNVDGHTNVYKKTVTSTFGDRFNFLSGSALGYFKDGETYECSLTFKQEGGTALKSYLLRMNSSKETVNTWNNVLNWWIDSNNVDGGQVGEWITTKRTITIESSEVKEKTLIDDGKFSFSFGFTGLDAGTDYTFYIADFKFRRVPEVSANSVTSAYNAEQSVSLGNSLSVAVDGYFDSSKAPKLLIDGNTETGVWENVVTTDKRSTASAVFSGVTNTNYLSKQYSANLTLTNIWGSEETNPITVNFVKAQSQTVEILSGDWATLHEVAEENDVTGNKWLVDKVVFTDIMNNGNALIKFSFTVKGVKDADYSSLEGNSVSVRMGSVVDIFVNLSAADLADGTEHTYTTIVDMGALNRYVMDDTSLIDRTTYNYSIMLRGNTANPLDYKNIKVEYFNPDAVNKTYTVARVKVKNNSDTRFSPEGVLVFAEYDSDNQLTNLVFKNAKYVDNGSLLNALGKDETKFIYCPFIENNNLAAPNSGRNYKAFWWKSFDDMTPLTEFAAK